MNEWLPGIFTWSWHSERHGYDFNGWLVVHPAGNILIDPVQADDSTVDAISAHGVRTILLTNRNHGRISARLRERTGAKVLIHSADRAHVESQGSVVDGVISAGDRVGPFVAVAASGKSAGELAFHWPERRLLVIGDACVGAPPGSLRLLPPAVIDDLAGVRDSLRAIARDVDFDTLLLGDGASFVTGGRAALQQLVGTFEV